MLEISISVNQVIHKLHIKTVEICATLMIHSGMGRIVTQKVSVVAMLTLLLGSVLIFLMKQNEYIEVRICGYSDVNNDDTPIGLMAIYVQ